MKIFRLTRDVNKRLRVYKSALFKRSKEMRLKTETGIMFN
jgi:hypothetical protein